MAPSEQRNNVSFVGPFLLPSVSCLRDVVSIYFIIWSWNNDRNKNREEVVALQVQRYLRLPSGPGKQRTGVDPVCPECLRALVLTHGHLEEDKGVRQRNLWLFYPVTPGILLRMHRKLLGTNTLVQIYFERCSVIYMYHGQSRNYSVALVFPLRPLIVV